jgi:hypothetical protein
MTEIGTVMVVRNAAIVVAVVATVLSNALRLLCALGLRLLCALGLRFLCMLGLRLLCFSSASALLLMLFLCECRNADSEK